MSCLYSIAVTVPVWCVALEFSLHPFLERGGKWMESTMKSWKIVSEWCRMPWKWRWIRMPQMSKRWRIERDDCLVDLVVRLERQRTFRYWKQFPINSHVRNWQNWIYRNGEIPGDVLFSRKTLKHINFVVFYQEIIIFGEQIGGTSGVPEITSVRIRLVPYSRAPHRDP